MSQKIAFAVCLLALCPFIAFATEGIRECPGFPMPHFVNISECAKAPCPLYRGKDVVTISGFTSNEYAETLKTRAHFREIESGIAAEFPLPADRSNTCDWLISTTCPVYPTEDVTYKFVMPVLSIYPKKMELDLKITVENENKEILSCFQVEGTTV
ncbi:NPC intracellular cholesterol transporter 2-like [Culicoides brevitarsis]|uniref:NPC intracellular cholesterol transporter 2-like n=1 Tax=Culicoides brevitarsis TaxID=469753 RepID=UPI00307C8CBE